MPENLKKGKILYLYLKELLVEQDKFIYLSLDKTLSNLVCNEDLKVLCRRWGGNYHVRNVKPLPISYFTSDKQCIRVCTFAVLMFSCHLLEKRRAESMPKDKAAALSEAENMVFGRPKYGELTAKFLSLKKIKQTLWFFRESRIMQREK